jgi:hypothetical protein
MVSCALLSLLVCAGGVLATPMAKRATAFFNPSAGGGSMLDNAGGGLGEPMNVSRIFGRAGDFAVLSRPHSCRSSYPA